MDELKEYKAPEYVKVEESEEISAPPAVGAASPVVGIVVAIAVIAITYA